MSNGQGNTVPYDSRPDTRAHIDKVRAFLAGLTAVLTERGRTHDSSKLESPEVEVFDVVTPRLKKLEYGSPEYKASLEEMGEALEHHYKYNAHHPEHFQNGVQDMTLVDLVEMFCDWCAATERHENGDIIKSIAHNKERFGFSDDLAHILENTAVLFHMARMAGGK